MGKVMNIRTGKFLKPYDDGKEYLRVKIDGRCERLHILVAVAFIPNPEGKNVVNHKNGDKTINEYWNLEWTTSKENTAHAIETGLFDPRGCAITTEEQRNEIRKLLALKKYSCREISEIVGVSKSIVSHIRYNECWDNENSVLSYTIRNRFSEQDIINLCSYFQNNPSVYSPEYMTYALQSCGLGTDPNLRKMAASIYFHRTYTNISNNFNF